MRAVAIASRRSPLLARLYESIEAIVVRLREPAAWHAMQIGDGATAYRRLACVDQLATARRKYGVGVHRFPGAGVGAMHDHRWPIAVFAVGEGDPPGTALYRMVWEAPDNSARGAMIVHAGSGYALEHPAVRHAVESLRPHVSIALADVTDPPSRENRLAIAPLDAADAERERERVLAALAPYVYPIPYSLSFL
jgi:hypothetical protein